MRRHRGGSRLEYLVSDDDLRLSGSGTHVGVYAPNGECEHGVEICVTKENEREQVSKGEDGGEQTSLKTEGGRFRRRWRHGVWFLPGRRRG